MRIWIDTDVIIDVLIDRRPHSDSSSFVWKCCETGLAEGYISALSIANMAYILRHECNQEKIKQIIKTLGVIFKIYDLRAVDIGRIIDKDFLDFEDELQIVGACNVGADYLVTRNIRHFKNSSMVAITPDKFLNVIEPTL